MTPIQSATFVVVDTETTGLDPEHDEVVEIAAAAITLEYGASGLVSLWTTLVRPEGDIPADASGIHHITVDDVEIAPSWGETRDAFGIYLARTRQAFPVCALVIAGHNLEFDAGFIGLEKEPRQLCTERLAHHLWNNAPNYKNHTLRYWRQLMVDTFGIPSHRALGDVLVTAALLRDMLASSEFEATGITDVDDLLAFAASPYLVPAWPFGKHYHEPIEVADNDYIRWALEDKDDLSPDFRYTLQFLRHMRETQMKDTDNARSLFDD